MFSQVQSLFTPCNGAGVSPVGCNAGPTSTLVTKLKQYGMPITDAYYNQCVLSYALLRYITPLSSCRQS